MGVRGELHSEKLSVADGKRVYFFNVKENRHGDKFIVIAENVFKFDDRVDRQQIVIYQEHLDDFRYALNKAVSVLQDVQGSAQHPRAPRDFVRPKKVPEKGLEKGDAQEHKRYRAQKDFARTPKGGEHGKKRYSTSAKNTYKSGN